jgi:acetyl esterase/lipase
VLDDYGIKKPRIRFVGDLWGAIMVAPKAGGGNVTQLEAGEPPLFVVHGAADPLVSVVYDDQLVARARQQGVPVEYLRIRGAGHGFDHSKFFSANVRGGGTPFAQLLSFASVALM